jgi:hypothetical protein
MMVAEHSTVYAENTLMVLSMDVDTRLAAFAPKRRPVTAAVWPSRDAIVCQSDESYTLQARGQVKHVM